MQITDIQVPGYDRVVRVSDDASGLVGFIAVHSTRLGPAAGGLRMRPYETEDAALQDVLRLARGMTFKNAAAGLPLGGGKAVILGDPARDKTRDRLVAFGRAVDRLAGLYSTAEDMGMTPEDMAIVGTATRHVAGLKNGPFASGDPSPITARGIFNAIRTTSMYRFGSRDLNGARVAVQGLGHVGSHLCGLLAEAGASLIVSDVTEANVRRVTGQIDATAVPPEDILSVEAEIFSPCAIGGILNASSIPGLNVGAVAGGANNQLSTFEDGARLHERGILYAPDFVANGGGIINVATEILQIENRQSWVADKLAALDSTMDAILSRAIARDASPNAVAEDIVSDLMRDRAA